MITDDDDDDNDDDNDEDDDEDDGEDDGEDDDDNDDEVEFICKKTHLIMIMMTPANPPVVNSSHFIFEEFARSDWMGLSGGEFSHLLKYNFST